MADTDTMKFGPQWLRQLSDGGGNVYSPPPTPVANLGHFGKFKMADYRYGKEEILALYQPRKEPPECLKRFNEILCEDGPQNPVSVGPLSEEEQRLLMHGVNSNQVYRMMSSTHRGTGSQPEVGAGDSGVGRGGGSGGGGSNTGGSGSGGGGAAGGAGRGGRGRGARRAGEATGDVGGGGGEAEPGAFNRAPPAPGTRSRGGRGAAGPGENPNLGRGSYRGRGDAGPTSAEGGDSNGDWRRVSRQRFPSESDTDWRRGPRTGTKEDSRPQQRTANSGGAGGGRVGGSSRTGGATKGNDSSGSWRQRPNSSSDQRHFGASPGGGSGRGRGIGREKGGVQRPDSEEEIPEWVNDENGRDESGTGFFDSSGAYKPTVGRSQQRSHRTRQVSSGSSGGGSFTRNNDSEDYWEDDWETEFELYDGLNNTARQPEAQKNCQSTVSNEDPEEEAEDKSPKAVEPETRREEPPGVGPKSTSVQKEAPPLAPKAAAVRPSVLAPRPEASGGPELALTDPSIKAIIPTPGTPVEPSVAASLQNTNMRWFYRDPQGRTQGPFTAAQMQEWFHAGFFDLSLSVRRACDQKFSPLERYFKAYGSQTFVGALPPNALSPVSPDPNSTLHLMLQQHHAALMLKQQQQQQQPKSPEKMAAGLVSPSPEMILLNLLLVKQQLLNSSMPVPDTLSEQIEALSRQQPSLVAPKVDPKLASPAANDPGQFPAARSNASPVDAAAIQQSTPSTQWPMTSAPSVPPSGSGPPEALWQQMAALREEMERQQQEQQRAKMLAIEAEEAELQRRRKEVEERERRLAAEEAERQELARRQEAERAELDRRRLEVEELEKVRLAQQREAEKIRRAREAELRRLEEEAEAAAAAAAAAEAEAALRRQVEAEREAAERRRIEEQQREAAERRRRQQEEKEAAERRRKAQQQEEEREAERRRRKQQEEEKEAEGRRKAQEEQQLEARRRQQEEEARRVQLNKFHLPDSARWASAGDGSAAPGLNLLEIQRLQQQKDEEEAQEARAMRLEREAAKLSAQRQAQLGPWNVVGSGGGNASAPPLATTPTGRQKSFMEIQAEERAREEQGARSGPMAGPKTGPVQSSGGSGASLWGSNWSSKVQQPPSPSAQAANRNLASTVTSKPAPAAQPAKGRSVWNYGGGGQGGGAKPTEAKGFPGLGAPESQKKAAAGQQAKKKGASSREEERVSKLFTQTERNSDDELTRWCKAAIDRVACPTTLDKSMFVEYLISMETAADIEEMMGAYHCDPVQTKKFVAEFLEKRRQFKKALAEGTDIVLPFTDDTFSKAKEDEFQKVGSSNKAGGNKRNRKKKAQKVSNLLNIKSTGDPDRVNVGEIEFAD